MAYRIQFAGQADTARRDMDPDRRRQFDTEITKTLGRDPYGHNSSPIKGDEDYRDATVSGVFVVYYVSYVSSSVLTLTAVRLVDPH